MDISAVFLKGMTFKGIAKEIGDTLRSVQLDFPPGDVWILRCQAWKTTMVLWISWTFSKPCGA
eukprot:7853508-Prorocentrum_lima.AAC.1